MSYLVLTIFCVLVPFNDWFRFFYFSLFASYLAGENGGRLGPLGHPLPSPHLVHHGPCPVLPHPVEVCISVVPELKSVNAKYEDVFVGRHLTGYSDKNSVNFLL